MDDRRGFIDPPSPMRPTEEITRLKRESEGLAYKVQELENRVSLLEHLSETVEHLQAILECGDNPAPVFLRWRFGTSDGCQTAEARFGKYRLEVTDGRSAVSWGIQKGSEWLDAGGGHTSFGLGMDEAEEALRRIVQSKAPPKE